MLVRGAARSLDVDEIALFLQPVADNRRNSRTRTAKLSAGVLSGKRQQRILRILRLKLRIAEQDRCPRWRDAIDAFGLVGRQTPADDTINEVYGCEVNSDLSDTWPFKGVSCDEPPTRTL